MMFSLKDHVWVIPLQIPGRVVSIQIDKEGDMYQVRYWWEGGANTVWMYPDEIRPHTPADAS